ncbi:MAG: hypothetical protein ABI862_12545 [Ilumatobacteraceae bacterium]
MSGFVRGAGARWVHACENGAVNALLLRGALGDMVAGDFSDPTNERIIYLSAAGLTVVGLALLFGTLVWWRRGRQEHPALAPLEVMGGRAWAKAPEGDRRRRLEHVRVAGASGSVGERVASEQVDLEALVRSVPRAFDDLREPSAAIELPAAPEPETDGSALEVPAPEVPAPEVPEADATSISTERPPEAVELPATAVPEPPK